MKYRRLLSVLIISMPILFGCNNKEEDTEFKHEWIIYPSGEKEETQKDLFSFAWNNGAEVTILPQEWMNYYQDLNDYMNVQKYYTSGKETTKPVAPTLKWEFTEECDDYSVKLSIEKNMSDPVIFSSKTTLLELKNLFAGTTYYYQIEAKLEDRLVLSKRSSFKTVDFFRTMEIDGVFNVRDIGNKKTIDGKKVKQDLAYRTANFDSVTPLGKEQAREIGIKTDLDLREKGPTSSPLGENVNYINNGFCEYGSPYYVSMDTGVNATNYQPTMRDNLRVFANSNNFPLAFHCAVGRDRTGTLAITLYLLLKVDIEQIKQDYVVSFFSKACNELSIESYSAQLERLIKYYSRYKGKDNSDSGTIYDRAEKYCLDIGLTKAEINTIRNNLLG